MLTSIVIAVVAAVAAASVSSWLAARAAHSHQLDVVVDVVRAMTGTLDAVLDVLKEQGHRLPRPRYPRDW